MKKTTKIKLVISLSMLGCIVLMTLLAPLLAPYHPYAVNLSNSLAAPSLRHFLGTDEIGRDVLSRVMYGGRQSILLALGATLLSMGIGCFIGLLCGYYGGKMDLWITGISNIFQGLPGISLMLAIAGIMGPGVISMITAIVINSWVGFSRLIRGEVLKIKQESFIEGVRALGANDLRILFLHIAPNLRGIIAIVFATRIASVILSVASLSFLGLGLQPPTADWGVMINDGRSHFRQSPLLVAAPGLCILLIALSVNLLADAMRDYFDINNDAKDM